MSIELVSYSALKDLLGLSGATIADYPALSVIQNGVVFAIEEYLGRTLEQSSRSADIFVESTPTQMIKLDAVPVSSVTSLSYSFLNALGETTSLGTEDYAIVQYGIRLMSKLSMAKISVTYTGGWASDDIPDAVKRAALLQTAYEFQSKDQIGAETISNDGGSVTRPALGLLKEVKRMLDAYKHPLAWW